MEWNGINREKTVDTIEMRFATVQKLKNKQSVSDIILVTTADKKSLSQLKTETNTVAFIPNIVDKSIEMGRVFEREKVPYDFHL